MGKIRIKHVGFGGIEQEEKKKAQKRRQAKKEKKKTARAPGLKGGERVVAVGPTPEELEKAEKEVEPQRGTFKTPKTPKLPKQRSSRYQKLAKLVDKQKLYSPSEAFEILKKMANTNFKANVEAHINLKQIEKDRRGLFRRASKSKPQTSSLRDKVLVETKPSTNRKATEPEKDVPEDSFPLISFEKKIPLAHAILGKVDEPTATLEKNLETLIKKVGGLANIKKLTLSTTMSPSLKIAFSPN